MNGSGPFTGRNKQLSACSLLEAEFINTRHAEPDTQMFQTLGGITEMSINNTIGSIYNLPSPVEKPEYRLEFWYIEFYNKQIEDISTLDVIRMLQQNILKDLAVRKAIEFLYKDPLAGSMYDGQLMEVLSSIEFNDSIEGLEKMISEVSLKLNALDWATTEDMEEYSDLWREFQEKINSNK